MDLELIVNYLNELFKKDPQCITSLLRGQVQCNDYIKDDNHCVVAADKHNGINTVSGLGLLNGILSKLDLGKIAVVISEEKDADGTNKILGFTSYAYNMKSKNTGCCKGNECIKSLSNADILREPKPTPAPPPRKEAPLNVYINDFTHQRYDKNGKII